MTQKIKNGTPIFLSIVASVAIAWYLCSAYNTLSSRWCLPLVAVIAGLSAFILPAIIRRFKTLCSIVSTGITLLILYIIPELSSSFWVEFGILSGILLLMMITTALTVYGHYMVHIVELIIDMFLVLLITTFIILFNEAIITVLLILLALWGTIMIHSSFFKEQISVESPKE